MAALSFPSTHKFLLLSVWLRLSQLALATLSLQELQAIANFPPSCQAAYQAPIAACPDATSFSNTSPNDPTSVCSRDCFNALKSATISIQQACQGTSAPPGTVIAHAFTGDLAVWLCTPGSSAGSSTTSNNQNTATSSSPSLPASISTSPSPTSSSSNSVSASSTTDPGTLKTSGQQSGSRSRTSVASSTTSSTPEQSTSSTGTTRTLSVPVITATTASQPTTTSRAQGTLGPGGGGSPFDQTVPNAAPSVAASNHRELSLLIGVAIAVAIG